MSNSVKSFDLKADSFSFPTLCLLTSDMDQIADRLNQQVERSPDFFHNTPLVIDLSGLPEDCPEIDFPMLVGLIRGQGIMPIGIRGGTAEQKQQASLMELAILGTGRTKKNADSNKSSSVKTTISATFPSSPSEKEVIPDHKESMIVSRPVRSGQKVYAAGGDLIVVAPVSSGAELMADGSIHVYATLRGRVLAGVTGNEKARVFCKNLQAELVSVAGRYMISEDYPDGVVGNSVQAYLEGDRLHILSLN